ncbi:threonine-phosphate decarboxylase [Clostridium homopropionicum DSM 5847]|uniref:Threonine-phosphate decarboxylase n=1 Tax=Clostridium homopropionicum DSM 5847 TaxID=1121318 RepID=A0A0L6Z9X2_9CLOT|nr:histidinol-phosphate transaminase [Clostridium homopropionicum]KOA19765.1 threonine-phosphate decarboxylase [Clostridium homopropionicum DSM 5847]SFF78013.1 L-threonine O-3-phosphate decarboxylase [Clostridium homopropionicum]
MNDHKSFLEHGGDIYTEGKFKGIELIDFSSNINFLGVPKSFTNNVHKALEDIICYPDLKYREAKLHISEYLKAGIREENIILGNGAAEIINLSIRALKKPCIVVPSFSEYETTAKAYSKEIVFSYLNEDFSYNYNDIMERLKGCDGLVIGNPNNPNGGIINKESFEKIIYYCEEHKKKIIIDEAFIEFVEDENQSFVDKCSSFKCLFIIRAFTKFFAMPGIRLGYGVSLDIDFIESLSKLQIPWNINTFAEIAIKSVLKDQEYINASKDKHNIERQYFIEELKRFNFIDEIYETHANFQLLRSINITGEDMFNFCLSRGVLIRRCRNFRGLDDRFIRLAIKSREDNQKLLNIFKELEMQLIGGK